MQASTIATTHRAPVISALAALAVAGGAFGVISIATNDDSSSQSSSSPAVTKAAPERVLDGSPLVRGVTVVPNRSLDGSPILRGTVVTPSRGADGALVLRRSAGGKPQAARSHVLPDAFSRPPKDRPEGFHTQP